jgi:hypothetical protein
MTSWLGNLSTLADDGGGGFSNLGTKSSHDDDIAVCYIIVLWRKRRRVHRATYLHLFLHNKIFLPRESPLWR